MPREFFLQKEPGARSDTFYQLPLLPADLKEKAESEAGAQMADQPPGLGKTQSCRDSQAASWEVQPHKLVN